MVTVNSQKLVDTIVAVRFEKGAFTRLPGNSYIGKLSNHSLLSSVVSANKSFLSIKAWYLPVALNSSFLLLNAVMLHQLKSGD